MLSTTIFRWRRCRAVKRSRSSSRAFSPHSTVDFQIHRQVSDGAVVMNERTDVMHRKGGGEVPLPVMGVFEVVDGQIAAWRDYFDMAAITSAFS